MPRSKRTVIDDAEQLGFSNYGTAWSDRGTEQSYTVTPVAPEDDWTTIGLPAPVRLPDGSVVDAVTLWGRGLLTFGAPTDAQCAYMATLPDASDLHAFLAGFPGVYLDAGFRQDAYGDVEYGFGQRDFVANPLGVFREPGDSSAIGPVKFDDAQARGFAYVTWSGEPYEGSSEDYDWIENTPIGPGGRISVRLSDEGIQLGDLGGTLHLDGTDVAVGDGGFIYYSELNRVLLTDSADVAAVTAGPEWLMGLGGDDRLIGGLHADRIDGGDGADVLVGGGGIDRLFGGDGADDLTDGDEQGALYGGAGDDVLRPGGGEDVIDGGEGIDRVIFDYSGTNAAISFALDPAKTDYLLPGDLYKSITGVEAVTFTAGGGDDRLTGAGGDDVLAGGEGRDALFGGDGADRLSGGADHDYLEGGAGGDWLDGGSAVGPSVIVDDGQFQQTYDLDANPWLEVRTVEQGGDDYGYWSGKFAFTATSAAQMLSLDFRSDGIDTQFDRYLYFVDANGDWVEVAGGAGNEPVRLDDLGSYDGDGNWVPFVFQPGEYRLVVSTSDARSAHITIGITLSGVPIPDGDTMIGGLGDDTYLVDSLYDRVIESAGEGKDTVVTSLSAYSLAGLPNVERLEGDASAQTLSGDAADNALLSGGGADTLDGAGGDDLIVISEAPTLVAGGTGDDTLAIAAGATVALGADVVSGVEKLLVRAGATLDLSALADPLAPVQSASDSTGGATIVGSGGADRIRGGAGADAIFGGAGDDHITLTAQAAGIDGGDGRDLLTLAGPRGTSYVFTGTELGGIERIGVGRGNLLDLSGVLDAPKRVRLVGGSQAIGSDGVDIIHGSASDDVIAGGGGADRMIGGGGADRFVFLAADDARATGRLDTITDFNSAEGDRIDLSAVGRDGFTFLGDGVFTGLAGVIAEVRVVADGDRSIVQVDLDHDTHADMAFVVRSAAPLTAVDFDFLG